MKLKLYISLLVIFLAILWASYAQAISMTRLENGNFILELDETTYNLNWYGEYMKVTGSDGSCFWLHETETAKCDLKSMSILFSK